MRRSIVINIRFGKPMEMENLKDNLGKRGVYLLVKDKPTTNPQHENIFYIGKATDTIFSRIQKHIRAILGKTGVNPGAQFIDFIKKRGNQLTDLWVVPGFMPQAKSYEISCAEELLLYEFHKKHGRLPEANTYKPRTWSCPVNPKFPDNSKPQ